MTAGFDLVIELSHDAVLNLVKKNMQVPGAVANPPFEITAALPAPAQGEARLIIGDIGLDMRDTDELVFTLSFGCGAIDLQQPVALDVTGLDGTIALTLPAQALLIPVGGSSFTFGVDWSDAEVDVAFSSAAVNLLSAALAGTAVTPAQFDVLARNTVSAFLGTLPAITTPVQFRIVPGQNGAFGDDLQFTAAEVHCIGSADPAKQALGLFGTMVVGNLGSGDHTLKTETAITPGRELAITMSPGAFRRIIFCPALAASFGDKLPTTCGSTPVHRNGLDITRIEETFHHGAIGIVMTAKRSGLCYDARGDASATLSFSIANNTLVPSVKVGKPDITFDIPWYCKIAVAVVTSVWGLVIVHVIDELLDVILDLFAPDAPGVPVAPVALAGFPGAVFNDVQISPEGLTLQADLPIVLSSNKQQLTLSGSVSDIAVQTVSSGTYTHQGGCLAGDYPWTETLRQQSAAYFATPTLLCRPIEYTWWIEDVLLASPKGQVTVPVDTKHPFPLPLGTVMSADVDVGYSISGDAIVLTNVPDQGIYSVKLRVEAKDAQGSVLVASQHVFFAGHWVQIENYAEKLAYCSAEQFRKKVVPAKWPDFEEPSPKDLIVITLLLSSLDGPASDDLLAATELAYGRRYQKAVHLHTTGQLRWGAGAGAATPLVTRGAGALP